MTMCPDSPAEQYEVPPGITDPIFKIFRLIHLLDLYSRHTLSIRCGNTLISGHIILSLKPFVIFEKTYQTQSYDSHQAKADKIP